MARWKRRRAGLDRTFAGIFDRLEDRFSVFVCGIFDGLTDCTIFDELVRTVDRCAELIVLLFPLKTHKLNVVGTTRMRDKKEN